MPNLKDLANLRHILRNMENLSKENIIENWYAFIKYLFPIIKKLPRDQKFLLGDRIQNSALDILNLFIRAYYTPKNKKTDILAEINIRLEQMRFLNRLTFESGYYNSDRYKYISEQLQAIGKQNGAWLKSVKPG